MPAPRKLRDEPYHQGLHSRGYLPHVKIAGATYFVTFRLADSLPQTVLAQLQEQWALLAAKPGPTAATRAEELRLAQRRQIEAFLDQGSGACHLRNPEVAHLVADALGHFHGTRYTLHAWVVMPNHVHALLTPLGPHVLGQIVKSWKQFSGLRAKRLLGLQADRFWQPEVYDHWVRDETERARIVRYILLNPVKAGFCAQPEDWPWSSAAIPPPVPLPAPPT
jgi:REP element-mobilizing transposase RayT